MTSGDGDGAGIAGYIPFYLSFLSSFTLLTFLLAENCQATREQEAAVASCLFSQLFLATDLICVHACACACMRVRVAPFNSLILFHFICVFASALLSSPSPSLSFPALPHFVASFHNDTLLGGAAQFVCGLYAIFHLDPATARISLM